MAEVIGKYHLGTIEYDGTFMYEKKYDVEYELSGRYDVYLIVEKYETAKPYEWDISVKLRTEGEHTGELSPFTKITTYYKLTLTDADTGDSIGFFKYDSKRYRALDNRTVLYLDNNDYYFNAKPYYNLDGTKRIRVKANFIFSPVFCNASGEYSTINGSHTRVEYYDEDAFVVEIDLPPAERKTSIITANNFNDESNPYFTYSFPDEHKNSALVSAQAAISFDGVKNDIAYRDLSTSTNSCTIELTDAERELLRQKSKDSGTNNIPIYYITKTVRQNTKGETATFYDSVQRILTIVGSEPQLNPIVKDIKEETLALTGDENTFVRYESMAEYAINATASKYAEIVHQSVTCGSKTIEGLPNGVIDNVESGTFNFYVTDSRNMGAASAVFKNFVEYVKPTCYQKVEINLDGEVDAVVKLTVNGNYYSGSFGAVDNILKLEVRYTDDNGDMGEWITLTGAPSFNDDTYTLEATFTGFNYSKGYTFQCRATDKLNVVESTQYTTRLLPVYDWSEKDFNFNVPININADNIDMHNETIIRHNKDANNTVISATGGHIYLRPGGTSDTGGEMVISPDGSVKFGGAVDFSSFTIGGNELADYVIESGEASMGSNGTWYWHKWASGKAECWGCRNFGNMAVTTAWGNLYRSAILTQDLPDDVFKTTPDVININIVNGNFGGWICKHENLAPSAVTTGSFIWVRPASATISPTYIGFHVIGIWK